MTDLDTVGGEGPAMGDDAFTADEQAAFDAMSRGDDLFAAAPEGAPAGEGAPEGAPAGDLGAEGGEPKPGEGDEAQARDEKGRFVPHGAFHEERERRKAAEGELNALREKFARGDERLRMLTEAVQRGPLPGAGQPQPAAVDEVPDPEKDIFGYVKHLEAKLAEVAGGVKQSAEAQAAEREHEVQVSSYRADAQRFAAGEPQFAPAYQHLIQSRAEELRLAGFAEDQIMPAVAADEMAIVQACKRSGKSPAETIFAMAKARGFQAKAPEPVVQTPPAETEAERVARLSKGAAAAKSLSAAGGAPAGEVTLEVLANMSEDEFAAFATKNPRRVEQLMGAVA